MTNREVLTAAADLIEQKGWCQAYSALNGDGDLVRTSDPTATCFCAVGAIMAVNFLAGGCNSPYRSIDFLGAHIEPGDGYREVTRWNDTSGRTAAEVIAKLREVAALPEAAE